MTRMTRPDCAVMCNLINTHTHTHTRTGTTVTGTRIGLGRAEGGQKSARNRKIAGDAVREAGETWVEMAEGGQKAQETAK